MLSRFIIRKEEQSFTESISLEKLTSKLEGLIEGEDKKTAWSTFTIQFTTKFAVHSFESSIKRLLDRFESSVEEVTLAVCYLENVVPSISYLQTHENILLALAGCLIIAAKFLNDECYENAYFAFLLNCNVSLLNRVEADLLKLLEFRLFVQLPKFNECLSSVSQYSIYLP